ncbi:MAG: hypothetical protein LPK02_06500 [Rhodobacterales bacterium]|nr:hypothetical protein [Rhodobacterales bacterium]MDX5412678.1 hypothetical protein [Rhodobacterales bacterium]
MSLGMFELHLTELHNPGQGKQADGMQSMELALGNGQQPQKASDLSVSEATQTLTVTIVKLPLELPSLREAERSTVTAHSALALATLELAQVLDPDYVQWLQPDMMLQTSSFLSVLEKVTPRRISAAERAAKADAARRKRPSPVLPLSAPQSSPVSRLFPDIDDTCDRLDRNTRLDPPAPAAADATDDKGNLPYLRAVFGRDEVTATATAVDADQRFSDEPSTASRLATWAVSIAVSLLSLPVGLALMVYNLIRGEDLRLAFTALALTGTFTGLAELGLIERAATALSSLPVIGDLLSRLPF